MNSPETSHAAADKRRLVEQRLRSGIEALTQQRPGSVGKAAAVEANGAPHSRHQRGDEDVFQPFPLTDMQEAYWLGRQTAFELGGTSIHSYRETEIEELDLDRLNTAWWALVQRHAALRSVVTQSGMQRMVEDPPLWRIPLVDLRGKDAAAIGQHLDATRQEMSHRLFPLDTWPQWEIRATRIDTRVTRLHIGFDGMLIDDRSYQILIREWLTLYRDPAAGLPPLEYSFRDFVLEERAKRESPAYTRALDYWRGRVTSLPESARLPLARSFRAVDATFVRYRATLDKDAWGRLKTLCLERKITPPGLLLSCFMEVLGRWSRSPELTVSVPTLNRPPFHDHINNVVGDFGSFILIGNDGLTSGAFLDRLQGIQQRLWDGLEHDSVSGVRIIRELMLQKKAVGSIQVPVVFTMASSLRDRQGPAAAKTERIDVLYGITQTPQVYLDHQAAEMQDALHFNWDVIEGLFRPGLMSAMFEAYCDLLRRLAVDASILLQASPVDIPAEQRHERQRANATEAPIPDGRLHDFGGALADDVAEQPAVISDRRTLSHRELTRISDALARRLVRERVQPNELVAIVANKGWEQIVAARAIVASGAAYLPVAADLPADYREKLLERTRVKIVLTQRAHLTAENQDGRLYLAIDDAALEDVAVDDVEGWDASAGAGLEPAARSGPDDLAYVIFTSGSTGEPKGVMIAHRSAVNTVHDVNTRFGVTSRDRILAISSLGFDLSVYDIFGALAVGAGIVVPAAGTLRDAPYLLRLIHEHGVTVWNSVPALMEMLVQHAEDTHARLPSSLRLVMMSGDWIPVGLPDRIRALCDDVEIVGLGGATEASIWSNFFPIHAVDPSWPSIPYGRPLANQRFHVLDAEDRDCPVWVPGRLCIEGTGLAVGYWGDRAETDRRFRARAGTGTRIYETGDWGLYLPGGDIEFLGRDDRQVKVNGFRVELDEIEAHLSRQPSVARAAVVKNKANQLMAVVVPRDASCSVSTLKKDLAGCLPAYMVPAQFRLVDTLPLTANGKVDYSALQRDSGRPSAAPSGDAPRSEDASVASADPRGQQLLEDIRDILQLEKVDTAESLVALGGSSIEIVRLSNRALAYTDGRLKLEDYFQAESVDALLAALKDEPQKDEPREPVMASPARRDLAARSVPRGDLVASFPHASVGLRTDVQGTPAVQLIRGPDQDRSLWDTRRSHRQYALRPVGFQTVSQWLRPLASMRADDITRYRYASAGGLYPVQVYLHVKRGRVSGLLGGDYYYHPEQHRLFEVNRGAGLDRDVYGDRNRPIYDQAAFCVFLVCPLDTIEASYGEWAYDLAMYEAGSIGQLLRDSAPPLGIGVCSIGTLDFARVRTRFGVDERHLLLHSFVCGAIGEGVGESAESRAPVSELDRATLLLRRIDALNDDDSQYLDSCMLEGAR